MTIGPRTMSDDQIEAYLDEPRNVVMGTVRKDGSPQLSALWFVYEQHVFYTLSYNRSAKVYNIRRDPRVVLCINAAHPDARSVTVYGRAELFDSDHESYARLEKQLAYRYHETAEEAEAYIADASDKDSSVVMIKPYKIIGHDYN